MIASCNIKKKDQSHITQMFLPRKHKAKNPTIIYYVYIMDHETISYKTLIQELSIQYNNNNNNLFLRSRPSQHTKLVYETPLFVGQGTPLDLTGKVYEGIHTLPPFGFEPVTSHIVIQNWQMHVPIYCLQTTCLLCAIPANGNPCNESIPLA
jgi:hypothetical protein